MRLFSYHTSASHVLLSSSKAHADESSQALTNTPAPAITSANAPFASSFKSVSLIKSRVRGSYRYKHVDMFTITPSKYINKWYKIPFSLVIFPFAKLL